MVVKSRRQLQKVFSEIDEENLGEITYEQFKLFVHKLGLGPKTTDEQVTSRPYHFCMPSCMHVRVRPASGQAGSVCV
jgi:hypothetical protein